jgi:DNA-binding XRE family transcriptional regulator
MVKHNKLDKGGGKVNYNLLVYRKMIGLTQKEIAKELKISASSYVLKESGKRDFTQTEMQGITQIFRDHGKDFTMEEIFLRAGRQNEYIAK